MLSLARPELQTLQIAGDGYVPRRPAVHFFAPFGLLRAPSVPTAAESGARVTDSPVDRAATVPSAPTQHLRATFGQHERCAVTTETRPGRFEITWLRSPRSLSTVETANVPCFI
jgi:hypothetical protein